MAGNGEGEEKVLGQQGKIEIELCRSGLKVWYYFDPVALQERSLTVICNAKP